jgi:hypothetical protein
VWWLAVTLEITPKPINAYFSRVQVSLFKTLPQKICQSLYLHITRDGREKISKRMGNNGIKKYLLAIS